MKVNKFGSSIETREDGSATVRTPAGGVLDIDKDRNAKLDLTAENCAFSVSNENELLIRKAKKRD